MDEKQLLSEVGRLRLRLQADPLLNLEFLAILVRFFREHDVEITADLLRSIVLALPDELVGTAAVRNAEGSSQPRSDLAERGSGGPPQTHGGPPQTNDGPPQTHDGGDGPPQTHDGDDGPPQTHD